MKIPTYLYLAAFALIASVEAKKGHHEDTYDPRLKVAAATTLEIVKKDVTNAVVTAA